MSDRTAVSQAQAIASDVHRYRAEAPRFGGENERLCVFVIVYDEMLATMRYGRDSDWIVVIVMWPVDFQTVAGCWDGGFDDDGIVIE